MSVIVRPVHQSLVQVLSWLALFARSWAPKDAKILLLVRKPRCHHASYALRAR